MNGFHVILLYGLIIIRRPIYKGLQLVLGLGSGQNVMQTDMTKRILWLRKTGHYFRPSLKRRCIPLSKPCRLNLQEHDGSRHNTLFWRAAFQQSTAGNDVCKYASMIVCNYACKYSLIGNNATQT